VIAEVKTLFPSNYRDIVAMMRRVADQIEAGELGVAEDAVFVLQTDKAVEVYGWGRAEVPTSIGLLELGKAKLFRVWRDAEEQREGEEPR
jgi:hypothetical protein